MASGGEDETKSFEEESESLVDSEVLKREEERSAAKAAAQKLAEAHGEYLPPSENDFDAKSNGGKRDKLKWARFLLLEAPRIGVAAPGPEFRLFYRLPAPGQLLPG